MIMLFSFTACAPAKTARKAPAAPQKRNAAPPAAPKMTASVYKEQQRYYDFGLRCYTEERYEEAQQAWRRVLQLGTRTTLAQKSEEYLKKVDRILKTLRELEAKQEAQSRQTALKKPFPPPAYTR